MTASEERALERAQETVRALSVLLNDYASICPRPWFERLVDWFFRKLR